MAGLLHGCARTTPCVRAELQASQASTRALAARYGLNPKTVAKWRARSDTADAPMGPHRPRSTVLTEAEEAVVVEFRRRTLLPLDDVLGCLRESIPRLTRSALHRCLERHGISRLPRDEEASSKRKRFAATRIGYVHIDSCELRSAEGKVHMFLAIDRVSKFAYIELHATAEMATGAAFMRRVVATFPYRIHTVLTDNGVAFTRCAASKWDRMVHPFDRVCEEHGIKHKLTKPYHPWTNGQAERMNRTVKEATVKTFHYETLESLKAHLQAFLAAYNFAKHLKALRWRTPFQAVCDAWKNDPSSFKINPHHLIPGPNRPGRPAPGPAPPAAASAGTGSIRSGAAARWGRPAAAARRSRRVPDARAPRAWSGSTSPAGARPWPADRSCRSPSPGGPACLAATAPG